MLLLLDTPKKMNMGGNITLHAKLHAEMIGIGNLAPLPPVPQSFFFTSLKVVVLTMLFF